MIQATTVLAAIAATKSTTNMSPISLLSFALAFAGVIVLCANALLMQAGGKPNIKLLVAGLILIAIGAIGIGTSIHSG